MDPAAMLIGIMLWALVPGFIARKKRRSFAGYFFLSLLISPLICIIITLCLKEKAPEPTEFFNFNRGVAQSAKTADSLKGAMQKDPLRDNAADGNVQSSGYHPASMPDSNSAITPEAALPSTGQAPAIKYCRKCGFELLEGSEFCSVCGTAVLGETGK